MQTVSNEDMHVPARFWLDPQEADRDAVAQAMRLCKLPFAVAAALILLNGLYTAPGPTGAGALVILAGIPLYLLFRRRNPEA